MAKFRVGVTWKEIVEHFGMVEVEAADEHDARAKADELNDAGEVEFKVIDGEFWSGPEYEILD